MVFTNANIVAGMVACTALTNNNVPSNGNLTTKNFNS
jgi:hypothetical protein